MRATGIALFLAFLVPVLLATGCGDERPQDAVPVPPERSARTQEGSGSRGGEASVEDFGAEAEREEREAIRGAFQGYLEALSERDYAAASALLGPAVRRSLVQFAEGSCTKGLPAVLAPSAPAVARGQAVGEVRKVRVKAPGGFVVFKAPGAELWQQTMEASSGDLRVATVAAGVLVPDL